MDLLSEYALCLGVCRNRLQQNVVHLLRLDDPHVALTRSWYPGEQFEAGKWYRKDQRLYKLADDIVETIAVRTMDLNTAVGLSQLCRENRTEGIVINQVMSRYETGRMQYCLIANKHAQLSIGVFPESYAKTVGESLQFWPM